LTEFFYKAAREESWGDLLARMNYSADRMALIRMEWKANK
jgi:hypothetical protein